MARRRLEEEHENHERWLVSYADFITLLFAFFTVLYATSQVDADKVQQFEKSIKHYMSVIGFARYHQMSEGSSNKGDLIDLPIDVFPPRGYGSQEVQDYVDRALDKALAKGERDKLVSGVRHDSIGVRISLAASALFASGSAHINESALESLNKIAKIIGESDRQIIIEGHTDDQPISTSRFPSNWELAAVRATTMVRFLSQVHKIDPRRLVAISYGDQKPIVANNSEMNRDKNRRVEILLVNNN